MNAELKAKWVEALRSGNYRQCAEVLHNDAGQFCCLGVLHHVLTGDTPLKYWGEQSPRPNDLRFLDERLEGIEIVGIVSKKNDGGESFTEIADWIEANL